MGSCEAVALFGTLTWQRPNKPMVPTAPTALAEPTLHSRRRHIGQPLGRERQTQRRETTGPHCLLLAR
jgi:hypothetical protein